MFTYRCVDILPGGSALHRHTAGHVGRGEDGGNDATETGHVDHETSVIAQPAKSGHVIWVIGQPAESASRHLRHCSACRKCVEVFVSLFSLALHKVGHIICHGSACTKCVTLFASLFSLHKVCHIICLCSVCTKCVTLFVFVRSAQSASRYLSLFSLHKLRHVICLCLVCTKCVTLFVFVQSAQSESRYLSLFSLHKVLTDVIKGCRLIA